ncbi:MAG TPA: hypothetical protein VNM72_15855 [Blastocatellia bacterium]|nr:hypothetical protein [Blastocatellia bacterium]
MIKKPKEIGKKVGEQKPALDKEQRLKMTLRQPNRPRRYVPSGRKGKR